MNDIYISSHKIKTPKIKPTTKWNQQNNYKKEVQTTSTKNHQHMPPKQLYKTPQTHLPCPLPKVQSFFFWVNAPTV